MTVLHVILHDQEETDGLFYKDAGKVHLQSPVWGKENILVFT